MAHLVVTRVSLVIERGMSVLRWPVVVVLAFPVIERISADVRASVEVTAGKTTVSQHELGLSLAFRVVLEGLKELGEALWLPAGAGVALTALLVARQRLQRRTVATLATARAQYEKEQDPNRETSGLRKDGATSDEDEV